jgi:hypothetical protein
MRGPQKPQSLLDEILGPLLLVVADLEFWLGMYVDVMRTARPQDDPYLRPWKIARDGTWLLLLVAAYLQYYFLDVQVQIAALPMLYVQA